MSGFNGASGVPKAYVDNLVAQSTAITDGTITSGDHATVNSNTCKAMGNMVVFTCFITLSANITTSEALFNLPYAANGRFNFCGWNDTKQFELYVENGEKAVRRIGGTFNSGESFFVSGVYAK